MKKSALLFLLVLISVCFSTCTIKLNGASIPAEMKSVTVNFFENNAPLVVPTMGQTFTEALKTRIRNQTRLTMLQSDGQGVFEGQITEYSINPVAITGSTGVPSAANNRMTITIHVKYTDNISPKNSFDQTFSRFLDFPETGSGFQSQDQFIKSLSEQLAEDIFNRAYANW